MRKLQFTEKEIKDARKCAFNEGAKHIGKESDVIHSLAEEYVHNQPYEGIEEDDAIYVAFIEGATSK